jgi:hypothetical protein
MIKKTHVMVFLIFPKILPDKLFHIRKIIRLIIADDGNITAIDCGYLPNGIINA